MNFTEWVFPFFLIITFALHWGVKGKELRLTILLIASAIFYGWWDWKFLGLIGFVSIVSWNVAMAAGDPSRRSKERDRWMIVGVATNLFVLGVFKYFNFFQDSLQVAMSGIGIDLSWSTLRIVLPVGISFYIFQAISYIVDVRRGDLDPDDRLRRVALYIGFFPQLVAGPIVRAASFFPQMEHERKLSRRMLISGFRAFLIGWVYKAGLSDSIALVADPVFAEPERYANSALIGATLAFSAQIYFDFAGYSMMAIGAARWFGFYIPKNFDFPYAASSIDAFWRRWHISLSSWLRDYLYIPLGGNRNGETKTYRNLFLTMLLGGLWHGAAWTFVIWGALHGLALAVHRAFFRHKPLVQGALGVAIGIGLTQLFVVLAWAPFRAETFAEAVDFWRAFAGMRQGGAETLAWYAWLAPLTVVVDHWLGTTGVADRVSRSQIMRRPAVYYGALGVVVGLLAALYPLNPAPFIYFQF